ncbi:hypothetical protein EPR50_G00162510 [Perca flavescens]|uniref:Uncharacterized protein n=1 Tax=Perca flavescens TaxID=8167 RepID=A0A484CHY0_PERFV|nr:hypothetical protein EPR50_G00162510 [Perca flavescens]
MHAHTHTHARTHTRSCVTHTGKPEAEQISRTHTHTLRMCMRGGVARMWDSLNDLGQGSLTSSQYCNESHYIHFLQDDPVPKRLLSAWITLVI